MYLLVIVVIPMPASWGYISLLLVQSNKLLADFLVVPVPVLLLALYWAVWDPFASAASTEIGGYAPAGKA
jgi:hypothetical protein